MNAFLNPLLHPELERWFRYGYTVLCIAAFGWNLHMGVWSASVGEVWGFLSFVSMFMIVGIWSWMMSAWRAEDARVRESRRRHNTSFVPGESIAVIPSSEANDPFVYAMMRAMESDDDKGVAIYQDEFGVWRDSDTDEPLPVQESKREDGAE